MRRLGWALVTLTALSACAPLVTQQPTDFTPRGGKSFRLTQQSDVPLSTGYSTTLRPQTRWQLVGRIPQGEVYRTPDQVVAVEGAHIHEAYIVVDHGALVGFYLPVERTFSPAARTQPLSTEP
jgi:hypothetical protein